jgi:hypothetical protein
LHEVIQWNGYNDTEKRLIWRRLDALLAQVLPNYFRIDNEALLRERMVQYRIPHRAEGSSWVLLNALLKSAARQIPDLGEFGITRLDQSPLSLVELREKINADLHQLAIAYYEKDYLRALQASQKT